VVVVVVVVVEGVVVVVDGVVVVVDGVVVVVDGVVVGFGVEVVGVGVAVVCFAVVVNLVVESTMIKINLKFTREHTFWFLGYFFVFAIRNTCWPPIEEYAFKANSATN